MGGNMIIKKLLFYLFAPSLIIITLLLVSITLNVGSKEGKIVLNRPIESLVFNDYKQEKLLLFFGYAGCLDVCTPKLETLAKIYSKLPAESQKKVGLLFVNLSHLEDPNSADIFAKAFHPDFEGLYLSKPILTALQREFQIYMAPSLNKKDEYDHTAFVYLLEKTQSGFKVNAIYTDNILSRDLILTDLKG